MHYSGPEHLLGGPVSRSAEGWTPLHMAATLDDATLAEVRPARCSCAGRRPLRARRQRAPWPQGTGPPPLYPAPAGLDAAGAGG